MSSVRDAILLGVRGATETHAAFRIREKVEERGGAIDVFGAISDLGVSLLFRPLDGLLGACVRLADAAGIVVTTRRDLHMQRFTAAHELGHFVLEHEGSLDREIRLPGQTANRDLQEVSADAFAAEFLMPRWLFVHHAKRHGWATQDLHDPLVVYQLSLRMAVSYDATCLGLLAHKIVDATTVEHLRSVAPKKSKRRLLGDVPLDDPWADVWLINETDDGGTLEAGPRDLFVVDVTEHAGSGYLWDTGPIETAGLGVLQDVGTPDDSDHVGGPSRRRLVLKSATTATRQLSMLERRPWDGIADPLHSFSFTLSTFGAEDVGLPRNVRFSPSAPVVH